MPRWVAFQRAVNVGGRKYPMAEVRAVLTSAGYLGVATHIQTGNILLESPTRSRARLESALEDLFLADRGFEVATIAFRPEELVAIEADATQIAAADPPEHAQYVELMRAEPDAASVARIEGRGLPGQRAVVRGRAVHLLFDIPFGQAKPPDAATKRALGVSTNRNVKVLRAIVDKWCR